MTLPEVDLVEVDSDGAGHGPSAVQPTLTGDAGPAALLH
jgi:hypothetical protein